MKTAHLIFPNQLFKDANSIESQSIVYLIEEFLFFNQFKFHKQKIAFHRASMKAYEAYLLKLGFQVEYIESLDENSNIINLIAHLKEARFEKLCFADVCDNWLQKRISETAAKQGLAFEIQNSQLFINTKAELDLYFNGRKKYFQTDFYIHERKNRNILLDGDGKPLHGKWSFDSENRLKYPKGKIPPKFKTLKVNEFYNEAFQYVDLHFSSNFGLLNSELVYPSTFEEAEDWLDDFLANRFSEFGLYEDAILKDEVFLHHSLLSPLINVGLLLPLQVIEKATDFAFKHNVPFNSLEGFVRQILGWREFIRAMYERKGSTQRTRNFWGFQRKIPASFYDGTTGIEPVDDAIHKLLKTGYNHHIERLMIVSNFMLLCEFHPDEVYRWFMEMHIDAYDWVMVPNVYGMGQFADGGLMCTKPYISGSNYIFKMSDYKKGQPWSEIWDALFWRFMHAHRGFFLSNPRLGMLVRTFDKMETQKQKLHLNRAESYLRQLD